MNLNILAVIGLLAFFGLLAAAAVAATVYSVIQQRRYDKTTLPDITVSDEVEVSHEDDNSEVIEENRFATVDDEASFDDEESNDLMKSIEKAAGVAAKPAKPGRNWFNKTSKETPAVESPELIGETETTEGKDNDSK